MAFMLSIVISLKSVYDPRCAFVASGMIRASRKSNGKPSVEIDCSMFLDTLLSCAYNSSCSVISSLLSWSTFWVILSTSV